MAFGEFTSDDLMKNSINPDDFLSLESTGNILAKSTESKNSSQADLFKSALEKQDEDDERSGYKLPLYNQDRSQQIGVITLRNI
jgi:hypothetical protein